MGMFTDLADLSGLLQSSESLKVSRIVQKAYIEVNENGTEAAGATGISRYVYSSLKYEDRFIDLALSFFYCRYWYNNDFHSNTTKIPW